jgi:hypothetical protein
MFSVFNASIIFSFLIFELEYSIVELTIANTEVIVTITLTH